MDDEIVRVGGTGREFVVGGSAALVRRPGHTPFFAQDPADAGTAGKVEDSGAGGDHDEAATPDADASAGESDTLLADYLDELEISPADRPAFDALGASLSADGISASAIHKTIAWVMARDERARAGEEIAVLAQHKYNVAHRFQSYDVPYLNWFLNDMHDAEVPQADVDRILDWYKRHESKFASASIALGREVDALVTQHRNDARAAMRQEWGHEYQTNLKLINDYLDGLPDAEREKIEHETLPDGRLALNDPARLRELAKLARGGGPEQSSKPPDERRAEIEKFMREHRGRYDKDLAMQAEYRDLLRHGEPEETAPTGLTAAEAKELADLERFLREHRAAYNKDEAKQARMRELYAKRGH